MTVACPSTNESSLEDEQKLRQKYLDNPELMENLRVILLNPQRPMTERFRCVFTLKSIQSMDALNILAEGFADESALLKHEIAYVMGQMKDERALPILERVLRDVDQDAMVRHEAAEAIGAISCPSTVPLLSEFLNDPSDYVRETCELAIAKIEFDQQQQQQQQDSSSNDLPENLYNCVDPAPALIAVQPTANSDTAEHQMHTLQKMEFMLLDRSLSLFQRYRALFTLRDIATVHPHSHPLTLRAIDAITHCFFAHTSAHHNDENNHHHNDENINKGESGHKEECGDSTLLLHELAYVLGQLSHPHALPALERVLSIHSLPSILRHECAEAIGAIGTEEAMEVLKRYERDGERVVRESVEVALDIGEGKEEFHYGLVQ